MVDLPSNSIAALREMDNATISVNVAFVRWEDDSEWNDRFWYLVDGMKWGETSIFEHADHQFRGDDMLQTADSSYLAVTKRAVFSEAAYVSMGILSATCWFFAYHVWAYYAVLTQFPSWIDRALYWVHALMVWHQHALIEAEEQCLDQCYHWNLAEALRRISLQITQRTAAVAALKDSGIFPPEIQRVIEDLLFHDVVREISVEMVTVKVLVEDRGLDHVVVGVIGGYLFGEHSMNSIQIHYPLGHGGHLKGRFKVVDPRGPFSCSELWRSMRFIRLVVVYQPDIGCIHFPPFFHANGTTLELDMASRELVNPKVVIQ